MHREDDEALHNAALILGEEANVLARLNDDKTFAATDHRVSIAISREISRLRDIADRLEGMRFPDSSIGAGDV
jgi:hypothetical protein